VLVASLVLSLYLGDLLSIALALAAAGITLLSLLTLLVWLLVRPSQAKVRFVLPAVLSLVVVFPLLPAIKGLAWPVYLWPRQHELDVFVQDLLTYGRIHEMSDGLRYHKSLNGKLFDSSYRVIESPTFPPLVPVLESEQIDPARYEQFRRRLIRLGFIGVQITNAHVALLYDGFLDNLHGVLWVRPGSTPPAERDKLFDTDLVSLRDLGNGWFAFGTT
jgi:hypothetical protein